MIKIINYARLSKHVYNPLQGTAGPIKIHLRRKRETLAEGFNLMTDVHDEPTPAGNFYAALYIKTQSGEPTDAIIAFRGTDMSKANNLLTDISAWEDSFFATGASDSPPKYMHQASSFVDSCYFYIRDYFPSLQGKQIRLTGHSLGGAIAKLLTLKAYPYPVVAFNAPGVGEMPGLIPERACLIHNINSKFGFINKIGATLGKTNYIDTPTNESDAKKIFQAFSKGLYKDSNTDYNANSIDTAVKNSEAFTDRIESFLATEQGLEQTKVYKNLKKAHHKPLFQRSILYNVSNHAEVVGESYKQIILAQHAIADEIKALNEERYRPLAMSLV
jgi:hypothetical protein